jgi:prevent-host-death family protein
MKVSARALENRLDEYLVRVRTGERMVVTVRGELVAEMTPIGGSRRWSEQALARMVERGELTRPRGKGLEDIEPAHARGRPVSDTVLEERGRRIAARACSKAC